jgi:hypothetical protein
MKYIKNFSGIEAKKKKIKLNKIKKNNIILPKNKKCRSIKNNKYNIYF